MKQKKAQGGSPEHRLVKPEGGVESGVGTSRAATIELVVKGEYSQAREIPDRVVEALVAEIQAHMQAYGFSDKIEVDVGDAHGSPQRSISDNDRRVGTRMSQNSAIEWTDATWNPWHGCHKISPGCKFCYMFREKKMYGQDPDVVVRSKTTFFDPLKWKEPRNIFTCSWSDFFIEEADAWRDEAYDVIRRTMWHTYQILTKRIDRAAGRVPVPPLPNVWLGVSVEDRKHKARIDNLRQIPAELRFLSLEPLLQDLGELNLDGIDWVIVGGESGPGARPMHPDWARSIRDQCVAAHVAFFFKQWGQAAPWDCTETTRPESFILLKDGSRGTLQDLDRDAHPNFLHRPQIMMRVSKKAAGRLLDGRTWDEMPTSDARRQNPTQAVGRLD